MRKLKFISVLLAIAFMVSCATMSIGQKPWYLDIQNWSSYQKANFFMNTWLAEENGYNTMNDMADKPPALIESLKTKQKVLEASRIPIRMYSQLVNQGATPTPQSEQEIIDWIRQMQVQYIYGGDK